MDDSPGPASHYLHGTWGQGNLIAPLSSCRLLYSEYYTVTIHLACFLTGRIPVEVWVLMSSGQHCSLTITQLCFPGSVSGHSVPHSLVPISGSPNILCLYALFFSPALISAWPWLSSLQSKFYLIVSSIWKCSWLLQVSGFAQIMGLCCIC